MGLVAADPTQSRRSEQAGVLPGVGSRLNPAHRVGARRRFAASRSKRVLSKPKAEWAWISMKSAPGQLGIAL